MDKNAIKIFAVESRRKMMESVRYQANLIGITANEISEPISKGQGMETYNFGAGTYTIYDEDIEKRKSLVREVMNKGFENVIEEVAYTWFNRIIAIRYMEVNDYLPTRTRVLSSEEEGKDEPDIVTEAFDLDLNYSEEDINKIFRFKEENKLDELFQFLFIKQCNKLNEILPGLFEKTDDWMELLLDINFTDSNGVIYDLINQVSEDDFTKQVEIIGWIYQYYISERKDEVVSLRKCICKDDIPSATQLFTTDWVVKYMVDNSLGRYWIERNRNSNLNHFLNFYLGEAKQSSEIQSKLDRVRSENINIEEIKFFDPCMGSGHILVYAFDVFFEIYKELGYSENLIPELILKNNIFGLDIDDRAYQLAYFAILMKARKYDRTILNKNIIPNVFSIQESNNINEDLINFIRSFDSNLATNVSYLKETFKDGKEFGSLINVDTMNFDEIILKLNQLLEKSKSNLVNLMFYNIIKNDVFSLVNQAKILNSKYDIVVTNPPYMNKYEQSLKEFSQKYYKDYSRDLFSMFMYKNLLFTKDNGYCGFMTPFVWMFLRSYEKLRIFIITNKIISSLIQFEYNSFNEIAMVPICAFVICNTPAPNLDYNSVYLKLSEFKGGMDVQKEKVLDVVNNINQNYVFLSNAKKFLDIPDTPISYWASDNLISKFKNSINIGDVSTTPGQNCTGNNQKYMRHHWEVDKNKIDEKWRLYAKGGNYRKWAGNIIHVVDWSQEAREHYKKDRVSRIIPKEYWYKKGITWGALTSDKPSFRVLPINSTYDKSGVSIFINDEKYFYYILGLLNSNLAYSVLNFINPTLAMRIMDIKAIPLIIDDDNYFLISDLTKKCYYLSNDDWDDYEISYGFKIHPLIRFNEDNYIKNSFINWKNHKNNQFDLLKNYEENLNELFSNIYGESISNKVDDKYISIRKSDYSEDIKSFISFVVGCMFGRYSLDEEGLQFAGGEFDINKYNKFIPDDDNIIPVLDTEYFNDDIVGRFVEFVKCCFGEETLEENLDFIAGALKKKGRTSREIIRNYFLSDFIKDHAQTYNKCPVYWQFDSGKQNGFKCLVYMHRYEPSLVARVRTDYLHKTQKAIEQNLAHSEEIIANSSNKSEISKATKDKGKYLKQLDEIRIYDEALGHIANQQIDIDLDDGVKVNYAKFQNIEISKEGEKTKKINLLKKI